MISRAPFALLLLVSACGQTLPPRSQCEQAPQAPADTAARTQEAELAIRQIFARQAEDWNRHDAKAWVAAFSDDADFINILGTAFQGRVEIERRHAELFASIFARSRVVVTTRKVRLLGATAAIVETDYELRDYDRLPPGIQATDPDGTLRTRLKYVCELEAGSWRIVAAQNTAVLPPRAPTPERNP
ncbi:MAG TPA: SgcJ/EcaC family oxidoreductase [Polyangiaceae bacterium]|nr:SgcJ/EcaC family oxidoreductase [Polyangiaceae bacterium]